MQGESSHLIRAQLKQLRPTQITAGFAAVDAKVEKWKNFGRKKREKYLNQQWFPAVIGPRGEYYIVDHHHRGLALLRCQITEVQLVLLTDFSSLAGDAFWMAMDHHDWVHPYNAKGRRDDFSAIPEKLVELVDDPYRSLAHHAQKRGGYAASNLPYAEFLWADFFRQRLELKNKSVISNKVLGKALVLARHQDARYLPGWCGVCS